jgi:hypothetical protein
VGAGVTATDDGAGNRTTITIPGLTGTGGHVIQDEGTPLTARAALNFIGAGVTASDDVGNSRTNITIASSQTPWLQDINGGNFNLGNVKAIGVGANANPVIAGVYVQTAGAGAAGFRHFDSATTGAGSIIVGNDLGHLGGLILGGSLLATVGLRDVLSFYTQSATPIIFATQEVERMRITAAGLMGIGKTPATYKLEVSGDIDVTGVYRINGVPLSAGASQTPWLQDINAATFKLNNSGGIGIGVASPTQALHVAKADNNDVILVSGSSTSVYMAFQSNATSGRITHFNGSAWGNILLAPFGGKVGIGIPATINYPLDVVGDVNISAGSVYRINGVPLSTGVPTSRQVIAGTGLSGGGALTADVTLSALPMIASGATGRGGTVPTPGATAGTTKFLREDATWGVPVGAAQTPWLTDINGNGKILYSVAAIGIQVASPQVALQIAGQIWSTADTVILEYAAHSSGYGRVGCMSFHPLTLWTNQLERVRILADGKVGIGTANPLNTFQVHAATDQNLGIRHDGAKMGIGTYNDAGTLGVPMSLNASSFEFLTGSVGIGTGNLSTAKLVVQATVDRVLVVRGDPAPFGFPAGMLGPILAGVSSDHSTFEPFTIAGSSINLMTGNVGINTTAPAHRLDVVGNCNVTGQYLVNGVPLSTGGSQTPWTQDIAGGGFTLSSAGAVGFVNVGATVPAGPAIMGGYAGAVMLLVSGTTAIQINNQANNVGIARFHNSAGVSFGTTYYASDPGANALSVEGRIGIGTTTPGSYSAGLTVLAGTAGKQIQILEPGGNGQYRLEIGYAVINGNWGGRIQALVTETPYQLHLNPLGGGVNIGPATNIPACGLQVTGVGQGTASPTFPTGAQGATLLVSDSLGPGASGGMIVFGARGGDGSGFCGIKGYYLDGGGNTAGAMGFMTRKVNTDTVLTNVMWLSTGGYLGINTTGPACHLSTGSVLATIKVASYDLSGSMFGIGVQSAVLTFGAGIGEQGAANMTLSSSGHLGIGIGNAASAHRLSVIPTAGVNTFALASQQVKIGEPSNIAGYAMTLGYGAPSGRYGGTIQAWDNGAVGTLYLNPGGGNIVMANSAAWGADTANMPLGTMMIYYNHTDGRLYFYVKRTDSQTIRQTNLLLT